MLDKAIAIELGRRAASHLADGRLRVDYYRIRRSLSYPLPVRSLHVASLPLRGIAGADYPWSIWLAWALEERLHALGQGEAAETRQAAICDLQALAAWPTFRQYDKPDLCLGHCLRTLATAWNSWSWLDTDTRQAIAASFARAIDDVLPLSDSLHGRLLSVADVFAQPRPHELLHNIPIIGTVGAALAARAIDHPARDVLDRRLAVLFGALLDGRALGIHEAAAYDGYVLDFMADWLAVLPEAQRTPLLQHPRLPDLLDQSCLLAAPGAAAALCEIGDVEPERMPFHLSAQIKLQALCPDERRAWWLQRLPLPLLRSEALAALRRLPESAGCGPGPGAFDAHYAAVLRSGDEAGDVAVAMAASSSPMGHIHHDNGSVTLASGGRWLIVDPGYQQYLSTRERDFTIGPRAHNAPLIDGQEQTAKLGQRPRLDDLGGGLLRLRHDLTACYAPAAGARSAVRSVWLAGRSAVVVHDRVLRERRGTLAWHWHGHPEAAWWIEDGVATLSCPGQRPLRISSPQVRLHEGMLDRLPGSRGQLTLSVELTGAEEAWWLFAFDDIGLDCIGSEVRLAGRQLLPG
jgi:hypothetical protein